MFVAEKKNFIFWNSTIFTTTVRLNERNIKTGDKNGYTSKEKDGRKIDTNFCAQIAIGEN